MKWAAILVVITAHADAAPITAPAGWTLDPALAGEPTARFAGAPTKTSAYAYRAPAGAVLHVNRAEAAVPANERDRTATVELDELRAIARRQGGSVKLEQDLRRVVADAKILEAVTRWSDDAAGVAESSRIVIAADATRTVAVTGQCVLAADVAADVRAACEAALATLDPEIAPASRVALAIVDSEPPPRPVHDTIGDGANLPSTPNPAIRVEPKPEADRRPVYVGAGLMVLAAVFYWNRRRREQLEREDARAARLAAREANPPSRTDGDDLHAAAEAGDDEERT